jgi:glycosyltransferase involved in cell wall biosynthesis
MDQVDFPYEGKIIILPTGAKDSLFGKFIVLLKRLLALKKIMRNEKPDILMSFMESANFLNLLIRNSSTISLIGVRNYLSLSIPSIKSWLIQYLFRNGVRFFYKYADKVFANSEASAKDLVENFKLPERKVTFIYNPIDLKYIREKMLEDINESIFMNERYPTVITVGRMTSQKGHTDLIKAFAIVKEQIDAQLIIMGDGILKQGLIRQAKHCSLEESVKFPGFISNVYPYLAKSTVFVLPSYYEGFPNVLLEAMAVGLPVISYDCKSGPREILENGKYGVLVEVGDYQSIAREIISLLRDDRRREKYSVMGQMQVEKFDAPKIAEEFKSLIDGDYYK